MRMVIGESLVSVGIGLAAGLVLAGSLATLDRLGRASTLAGVVWLVGTDSGLLEQPHDTTRVQLSPGERAEIVVEVSQTFTPGGGDSRSPANQRRAYLFFTG